MPELVWKGLTEFNTGVNGVMARVNRESRDAMSQALFTVRSIARKGTKQGATGKARAGIGVEGPIGSGTTWTGRVGTSTPYGRRLWLGFHETDSLGRKYNQRGKNALKGAQIASRKILPDVAEKHWSKAIRGH